jgi:hypothetical protein
MHVFLFFLQRAHRCISAQQFVQVAQLGQGPFGPRSSPSVLSPYQPKNKTSHPLTKEPLTAHRTNSDEHEQTGRAALLTRHATADATDGGWIRLVRLEAVWFGGYPLGDEDIPNHVVRGSHFFYLVEKIKYG